MPMHRLQIHRSNISMPGTRSTAVLIDAKPTEIAAMASTAAIWGWEGVLGHLGGAVSGND